MENIEFKISNHEIEFSDALLQMQTRVDQIIEGKAKEMIWILEHKEVYTAGVSAKEEDFLGQTDVPVIKTNRGGKYTYHGKGMKIIYVMLDLKKLFAPASPDISEFVKFLENIIISSLKEFGIEGEIKKGRVGIWVNHKNSEKKIAAIGIKIKKWVSYHGIAINVEPDLSMFEKIIPCGIKEFGVTSMKEVVGNIDEKKLIKVICEKFQSHYLGLNRK